MKKCKVVVLDEVNVRVDGLDASLRRKLSESSKYFKPSARYTPAYKLGRWDGKIGFFDIAGRTYLNFIDTVLPKIVDDGYDIELIDNRKELELKFGQIDQNSYSFRHWPDDHPTAPGQPIILKDHQVEYVNTFLKSPQGIGVAPTGAGKTISTAILADKIGLYGRSITIVPSKDLVTQTERDYKLLGLDVGVFFGDRKDIGKTHTICTWQSLEALISKRSQLSEIISIEDFLVDVAGVIVDETHKAKSDVLKKMLLTYFKDTPIRWGLTGTIPKEEWEKITLEISIGPVLGRITAKELQERGVLANLHITMLQLQDYENGYGSYHAEYAWLTTNEDRLKYIARRIIEASEEGNCLVLVDRIQTGEMLQKMIQDSVFIHGVIKSADRKAEYDRMKQENDRVTIATYGVASTGIDIPRIFNLFLIEPGKSFVRVIQSIGRGIRIAKDKDFVNVYDVCSCAKYAKKHAAERKKFYKESEYPFTVEKVEWLT